MLATGHAEISAGAHTLGSHDRPGDGGEGLTPAVQLVLNIQESLLT